MATLTYPKNVAIPFDPPVAKDCVDCGNNDYCRPINPTDPISFQTIVNPTQTEVSFSMADFTGTNWTVTDGVLIHTPGSTANATLPSVLTMGRRYRLKITTSGITTGDVDFALGSITDSAALVNIGYNGTFYMSVVCSNASTNILVRPTSPFDGSIVIESIIDTTDLRFGIENIAINGDFDTSASWVGGTDWSWGSGIWTKVAGATDLLAQTNTTNVKIRPGKAFKIIANITVTAGSIRSFIGNVNQDLISYGRRVTSGTDGIITFYGYLDADFNPLTDRVIGFEPDATCACTIDWVEIFELEEDHYKLINCDTDEEVADIPNEYINRVTNERTIVQIPSIGQLATATNLITDGNFDSPLHEGTATADTGATFEDSGVDFSDVAGDNLIKNDTDGTYDWVESVSGDEVTTWNTLVQTGEDYTIWRWRVGAGASWEIYDGYALHIPDNESTFYQGITINTNSRYIAKVTISNYVSGSIQLLAGSPNFSEAISGNGTHSVVIETGASATQFFIVLPTSDFDGRITGLELYESLEDGCYKICSYNRFGTTQDTNLINDAESRFDITGNWVVGGDDPANLPVISGGVCTFDTDGGITAQSTLFYDTLLLTPGTAYNISFDVSEIDGSFHFTSEGVSDPQLTVDENGHYSFDFTAINDTIVFYLDTPNSYAVLDNVYIRLAEEAVFTQDKCTPCLCLEDWSDCTRLFSWTNDDDAFGIDYTTEEFIQYMRLGAEVRFSGFPTQRTNYIDSNGTNRLVVGSVREEEELYIEPAPRYVHQALAVALNHDHFYIDDVEYNLAEGQYEPTRDRTTLLQEATVPVEITTQDNYNANC